MSTDQLPHPVQPAARVEELLAVIEQQADRIADLEMQLQDAKDELRETVQELHRKHKL